jgi:uncharacterized protein YcsI (UPF0317 family)
VAVVSRTPAELRNEIRSGRFSGTTAGLAPGFAQANLVVLKREWAEEFRAFCLRNPRPCPLLDMTEPGSPHPLRLAPDADLRTDVPGYRVFSDGRFVEVTDLRDVWSGDVVSFLIGCSFSFERALLSAGLPLRHIELGSTVPMYVTSRVCAAAGRLGGPMVVSMRPLPEPLVERATAICSAYPGSHGPPVHVGDPAALGIRDLTQPDFGDPVPIRAGEVPVFWGCGVTPQVVLERSGCEWFAAHRPGRMFVSDRPDTIGPLVA